MPTRKNQPHRKLRRLQTALNNFRVKETRENDFEYLRLKIAQKSALQDHISRLSPLARAA